jgi:small subunit ribosomal protein S2
MPYVNYRCLGGMMTNHNTINKSIKKLEIIKKMREEGQFDLLTKKEALMLTRKEKKLELYFGGIKVVAPVDTNCDPDLVDFPIPGNDDAIRSIQLFCNEMAEAMNEGKAAYAEANGEVEEAPAEVTEEDMKEVVQEAVAEETVTKEAETTTEATETKEA